MEKPLAKSLHTITVLTRLARHFMRECETAEEAMTDALCVLGLDQAPDPYGLRAKALAQISE